MLAVQGVYDGKVVVPKGEIPYSGSREVIIMFPDTGEEPSVEEKLSALQQITGIAAGSAMTLDDIQSARLARQ